MFDFNKLDKYRKFMQEEGVNVCDFEKDGLQLAIRKDDYILDFYCKSGNTIVVSDNWNKFKEKVANYFLQEDR